MSARKTGWTLSFVTMFGLGFATAQADFVENFDLSGLAQGDSVVGADGWQTVYFYGEAQPSSVISGPLDAIGGRGFGTQGTTGSYAGAAHSIGGSYTSGTVTMNAKIWGDPNNTGWFSLFLGTSDLAAADNNGVCAVNNCIFSNGTNWFTLREGGTDAAVSSGATPFGSNTWYEYEIGINMNAKTAYEGYYTLDQGTLARNSVLNTLASFGSLTLPSISYVGYLAGGSHLVLDEINVTHSIPEPATLVLVACGLIGLLAYTWWKRS